MDCISIANRKRHTHPFDFLIGFIKTTFIVAQQNQKPQVVGSPAVSIGIGQGDL